MHIVIAIGLMLGVTFSAGQAHARSTDSCQLIETLVRLPVDLTSVRTKGGSATAFQMDLRRSLGQLSDRRQTSVFTRAELRAMRIFAGAVREDWKLNGRSPNGRQIPGLTKTSTTIQTQLSEIVVKFGCEVPGVGSASALWKISNAPISPLTLLLAVVSVVLAVLGIYRLVWRRYQSTRRICNVPALLLDGDTCLATTIRDISRGGAMVANPAEAFSPTSLTLQLPGHTIASRVAWTNSNFIGLNFDKMLSSQALEEILAADPDVDPSENPSVATSDRSDADHRDSGLNNRATV